MKTSPSKYLAGAAALALAFTCVVVQSPATTRAAAGVSAFVSAHPRLSLFKAETQLEHRSSYRLSFGQTTFQSENRGRVVLLNALESGAMNARSLTAQLWARVRIPAQGASHNATLHVFGVYANGVSAQKTNSAPAWQCGHVGDFINFRGLGFLYSFNESKWWRIYLVGSVPEGGVPAWHFRAVASKSHLLFGRYSGTANYFLTQKSLSLIKMTVALTDHKVDPKHPHASLTHQTMWLHTFDYGVRVSPPMPSVCRAAK